MVETFEVWIDEIREAAAEFDGYAGMDVVRPTDPSRPTYVIILRFASHQLYAAWHDSPERAETVERSLDMTTGPPAFEQAHGLEAWFTPEADSTPTRPVRYKTTIVKFFWVSIHSSSASVRSLRPSQVSRWL